MFICCFRLLILLLGSEHADVEFGKLQSKDLLQHLRTGAISNASLEVVQAVDLLRFEQLVLLRSVLVFLECHFALN